jgi:hypothetical protein
MPAVQFDPQRRRVPGRAAAPYSFDSADTGLDCLLSSNQRVEYNSVVGYTQNDPVHTFHWHITTLMPHLAVQDLNLQEHGDALLDMLSFAQHLVQTSQLPAYRLILQSSDPQFGYHLIH